MTTATPGDRAAVTPPDPAGIIGCPVRACGRLLERVDRTWRCALGHSFDISRAGYVNLLQPQDRKSSAAGDAVAALDARQRLLSSGVGRAVLGAILDRGVGARAALDLGCGAGDALGALAPPIGIGVDLSVAAIERAARRWSVVRGDDGERRLLWIVANADRRLPIVDDSIDLVLSIHARRHADECARVLRPGGRLIVAVPAEDDLIELRGQVLGDARPVPRGEAVVDEHAGRFALIDRFVVREHHRLERAQLLDLLRGTYRGVRRSAAAAVESLDTLDVTVASEVLVFRTLS